MSEPAPNAAPPPPDPLAVALAKLDPAPHGFDRDALMFAACQSSKMGALAFWKWTAGIAAAAAIVFACLAPTVNAARDVDDLIAEIRRQVAVLLRE